MKLLLTRVTKSGRIKKGLKNYLGDEVSRSGFWLNELIPMYRPTHSDVLQRHFYSHA